MLRSAARSLAVLVLAGCVGEAPVFTTCSAEQLECDGRCVDPRSDWRHCGATDCGAAQSSGSRCGETSACLEGTCVETGGAFVSPGQPDEGASVHAPRPIELEISFADRRRLLYTFAATGPRVGEAGSFEADAPLRLTLANGQSVRWAVEGEERVRSFGLQVDQSQEGGQYTEKFAFAKSGSATVIAAPGERLEGSYTQDCWSDARGGDCYSCTVSCGVTLEGFTTPGLNCLVRYTGQSFGVQLPERRQFVFTAPGQPGTYFVRAGTVEGPNHCNAYDGTTGVVVGKVLVR